MDRLETRRRLTRTLPQLQCSAPGRSVRASSLNRSSTYSSSCTSMSRQRASSSHQSSCSSVASCPPVFSSPSARTSFESCRCATVRSSRTLKNTARPPHVCWVVFVFLIALLSSSGVPQAEARTDSVAGVAQSSTVIALSNYFATDGGGHVHVTINLFRQQDVPFGDELTSRFFAVVINRNQVRYTDVHQCTMATPLRYEMHGPNLTFTHALGEEGEYRLLLLNCDSFPRYYVQATTEWTLHDGTHLSLPQSMLPRVYLLVTILWLFYALLWLLQCLAVRLRLLSMHWGICSCVTFKVAQLICAMMVYAQLQADGEMDVWLMRAARALAVAGETMLLALWFLLALGQGVYRAHLNGREKQLFFGALGLAVIFNLLNAMCLGPAALCSAYMLSYRTIKVLVLMGVFMALSSNVDRLRMDLLDRTVEYHRRYILPKIEAYRQLMLVALVYLLVPVCGMILSVSLFAWTQSWLETLVDELTYLFALAMISLIFRPSLANRERLGTYFGMDDLPFEAGLGEGPGFDHPHHHHHHQQHGGGGDGHGMFFGAPGFGPHHQEESSSSEEEEEVLEDDAIEEDQFSDEDSFLEEVTLVAL